MDRFEFALGNTRDAGKLAHPLIVEQRRVRLSPNDRIIKRYFTAYRYAVKLRFAPMP
jgi:hypothetical protein